MLKADTNRSFKKRVFVVDDHPVFREGLVRIIAQEKDLSVCGDAADAEEALKQAKLLKPDLMVIDISLEGTSGIDLVKALRNSFPKMRLLILSMHPESLYAERALRAGANGYIMKRENRNKLLTAMRLVLDGKTHISQELNDLILQRISNHPNNPNGSEVELLSNREFEVFQLIGQGLGTRQIADKLAISMKTIEVHREHIKKKLRIEKTPELVQRAIHWTYYEEKHGATDNQRT